MDGHTYVLGLAARQSSNKVVVIIGIDGPLCRRSRCCSLAYTDVTIAAGLCNWRRADTIALRRKPLMPGVFVDWGERKGE